MVYRSTFLPSVALSLAVAAGLVAGGNVLAADPPVVPTVAATPAGTAGGFEIDGSLQAVRQSTIGAQVGGNVLQLAVKAGERVRAGQLLVRIDERDVQAALARADAGVAQAEAEARNARVNLDRTRELRTQGFVSQAALDVADTQSKAAQAGLQQAQAARAQAALARGFAAVKAPFDAVVLSTQVDAGDLATPGRPLVTVYAPGAMRAVVQLPASRAAQARAATGVQVQLPDGRWVAPAAREVLAAADPVSQTVEWRLDLARDASAGLMPGQAVRVRFSGEAAPAAVARPSVPVAAVLRRGELTAVYVQQGERFVLRAVRVGAVADGRAEVLAGLNPGERVAVDALRAGLAGAVAAK